MRFFNLHCWLDFQEEESVDSIATVVDIGMLTGMHLSEGSLALQHAYHNDGVSAVTENQNITVLCFVSILDLAVLVLVVCRTFFAIVCWMGLCIHIVVVVMLVDRHHRVYSNLISSKTEGGQIYCNFVSVL